MKKLITKSQQERINRRNQFIIGIVLMLLMVLSTLGYALMGSDIFSGGIENEFEYNDVRFTQNSGIWTFILDGQSFNTRYNPKGMEDISVPVSVTLNDYINKPLYFAEGVGEPVSEIGANLHGRFTSRTQEACLADSLNEQAKERCANLPIKNCFQDNIIVIREPIEKETEGIRQEGKCVFITASLANQTRYSDAFLFKILGIKA
jgi:hypothetical protein